MISGAEQKALVSRQGGVHRRLRPAGREQMGETVHLQADFPKMRCHH